MTVLLQTGIRCVDNIGWNHLIAKGEIFRHWQDDDDGMHVRVAIAGIGGCQLLSRKRFKPVYRVPAPMVRF